MKPLSRLIYIWYMKIIICLFLFSEICFISAELLWCVGAILASPSPPPFHTYKLHTILMFSNFFIQETNNDKSFCKRIHLSNCKLRSLADDMTMTKTRWRTSFCVSMSRFTDYVMLYRDLKRIIDKATDINLLFTNFEIWPSSAEKWTSWFGDYLATTNNYCSLVCD